MRIVGIIPARIGSSRLPRKPLLHIKGKPLIQYVYENTQKLYVLDEIWVATDDKEIKDCVEEFGGKAILTSPHHSSGTERVREAAQKLGVKKEDLVLNLQGDEPFLHIPSVERLIEEFKRDKTLIMGTLAFPSQDREEFLDPNVVKVVTDNRGFALYFSRSPIPYSRAESPSFWKHLGVYLFRFSLLEKWTELPPTPLEKVEKLEQLRAISNGIPVRVMPADKDSIGVDTEEDLKKMERLIHG